MASLFTRIVNGEIPCFKVAEEEHYLAFLDIAPIAKGHTLVIPKKEVDYIFDLDETTYLGLMAFAKKVAKAIDQTIPCQRVGVAVVGLEVPHVHVHLIPLQTLYDIDFTKPKLKLAQAEMQQIADTIHVAFSNQR